MPETDENQLQPAPPVPAADTTKPIGLPALRDTRGERFGRVLLHGSMAASVAVAIAAVVAYATGHLY